MARNSSKIVDQEDAVEEEAVVEQAAPVAEEPHPLHDRLAKIEEDVRKIKAKLHHM